MPTHRPPTLLAFLVLLGAGCTSASETASSPSPTAAPDAHFSDSTGAISGVVLDDQIRPIPGAIVGVKETGANGTSDSAGHFTFSDLAPATYTVLVNALGFESQGKPVTVSAGQSADVKFILTGLPTATPYTDVQHFDGLIECGFGTAAVVGNCIPLQFLFDMIQINPTSTRTVGKYPVTNPEKVVQGVFEMAWTPSTAGSGQSLGLYVDADGTGPTSGTNYAAKNGPSPVKIIVDSKPYKDLKPDQQKNKLQTRTFLPGTTPPSYTIEQRFTVYETACYVLECGDQYTVLRDK